MSEPSLLVKLGRRILTMAVDRRAAEDRTGRSAFMGIFGAIGASFGLAVGVELYRRTGSESCAYLACMAVMPACLALGTFMGHALWQRLLRKRASSTSTVDRRQYACCKLDDEVANIRRLGLDAEVTSHLIEQAYSAYLEEVRRIDEEEQLSALDGGARRWQRFRITVGPADEPPPSANPGATRAVASPPVVAFPRPRL
ncbi:hypothetical protein WME94_21115 [Sorangium sp. So ce429]